jgi:hypothetical protein
MAAAGELDARKVPRHSLCPSGVGSLSFRPIAGTALQKGASAVALQYCTGDWAKLALEPKANARRPMQAPLNQRDVRLITVVLIERPLRYFALISRRASSACKYGCSIQTNGRVTNTMAETAIITAGIPVASLNRP